MRTAAKAFSRRWWLLILATGVGAGLALALANVVPLTYTADARVFVSAESRTDPSSSAVPTPVLRSYADAVGGREIIRRTRNAIGGDEALGTNLRGRVVSGTQTIEIRADARTADDATAVAAEATEQLIGWITEQQRGSAVAVSAVVSSPAAAGSSPSSPRLELWIPLGALTGLLLAAAVAWRRERAAQAVETSEDAEDDSSAPVLGVIGHDRDFKRDPLISSLPSHHPRYEAVRILRTNLQFLDVDRRHKVVTVTSALPGEGKSTTAANLAIAIAQTGRSVALVEGDLRRPRLADLLGLEKSVGLTTVLVGRVALESALQPTHISGLEVLTSGTLPPNPSEILQTSAMDVLIGELRERFDVVLIDAPPLLPVTDAALLGAISDGALVLARHGHTGRDQLRKAIDRLHAVGARVLGTVLTMSPRREIKRYGYGYGYGPEFFAHQVGTPRPKGGSRRAVR